MNLKKLFIAIVSVFSCISIYAENKFYIEDFSIEPGETKELEILLTNDVEFSAFQADIYIPEGLTVYQEDGEYIFDLSDRKYRDHTLSAALQVDNAIRLLSYSTKVKNYSGNEGALVYFTVTADADFSGTHQIEIRNIVFTQADETEYQLEPTVTTVTGPTAEEPISEIPVTINDSEKGQVVLYTTPGNAIKFAVETFENWKINSIAINGVDVTSNIANDGTFTTDALTDATTICITYGELSDVEDINLSNIKVYGYNSNIYVSGAELGNVINVYDANGALVKSIKATNNTHIITLEVDNVYIVKCEGKTVKVRL